MKPDDEYATREDLPREMTKLSREIRDGFKQLRDEIREAFAAAAA